MWQGVYEAGRFDAIARLVRPGDHVWDVGAHYGYATLIADRCAGPTGRVTSFEPSGFNRWYLEQHLRWNAVAADVVPVALSDVNESANFGGRGGSVAFHLGGAGERVDVRTITRLVEDGRSLPDFIKVDVEGEEVSVLDGARSAFTMAREGRRLPLLLVSLHGPDTVPPCVEWAHAFDYRVLASRALSDALSHDRWHGDPDVLLVPPNRASDLDTCRSIRWFTEGDEL